MPYPCSGPIASSALSTIRSSVPCRIPDLRSTIATPVDKPQEYRTTPVRWQQEDSETLNEPGACRGAILAPLSTLVSALMRVSERPEGRRGEGDRQTAPRREADRDPAEEARPG